MAESKVKDMPTMRTERGSVGLGSPPLRHSDKAYGTWPGEDPTWVAVEDQRDLPVISSLAWTELFRTFPAALRIRTPADD